MTSKVYKIKGPGHKDRANPPFCFHCWSHCGIAIVPPTSARLYSIDYLHWGHFAELKEITVSINRLVFLPFYVRIECFQKWPQGMTPWPNASIFQSERGGSNSIYLIRIISHCFPLVQKLFFFSITIWTRSYTVYLTGARWLSCILTPWNVTCKLTPKQTLLLIACFALS